MLKLTREDLFCYLKHTCKSNHLLINWPALFARLDHDEVRAAVELHGGRPLYRPQLVLPVRRPVAEHLVVAGVQHAHVGDHEHVALGAVEAVVHLVDVRVRAASLVEP